MEDDVYYTVKGAIASLVKALQEDKYEFDFDKIEYHYHAEQGHYVRLSSSDIPDFPSPEKELLQIAELGWTVHQIVPIENGHWATIFILEEDI